MADIISEVLVDDDCLAFFDTYVPEHIKDHIAFLLKTYNDKREHEEGGKFDIHLRLKFQDGIPCELNQGAIISLRGYLVGVAFNRIGETLARDSIPADYESFFLSIDDNNEVDDVVSVVIYSPQNVH